MKRFVQLHILLTPNKEHKKVFPNVHVAGFQNGLRITWLEPNYRRCEPCGKKLARSVIL